MFVHGQQTSHGQHTHHATCMHIYPPPCPPTLPTHHTHTTPTQNNNTHQHVKHICLYSRQHCELVSKHQHSSSSAPWVSHNFGCHWEQASSPLECCVPFIIVQAGGDNGGSCCVPCQHCKLGITVVCVVCVCGCIRMRVAHSRCFCCWWYVCIRVCYQCTGHWMHYLPYNQSFFTTTSHTTTSTTTSYRKESNSASRLFEGLACTAKLSTTPHSCLLYTSSTRVDDIPPPFAVLLRWNEGVLRWNKGVLR